MSRRSLNCLIKRKTALANLAEKAVRFANTTDEHGDAWDTETDVLRAAVNLRRHAYQSVDSIGTASGIGEV